MTEKQGEAVRAHSAVDIETRLTLLRQLITNALTAGGLKGIGVVTLFGANAALPHASASVHKRLEHGEFALVSLASSLAIPRSAR